MGQKHYRRQPNVAEAITLLQGIEYLQTRSNIGYPDEKLPHKIYR